jgi:hypothetical protein
LRTIESNEWWPELVALKDELSLRELAERFQVTPGAIVAALKRGSITRSTVSGRAGTAPPGDRPTAAGGDAARRWVAPSRPEPDARALRGAWKVIAGRDGAPVVRVVVADSLTAAATRVAAAGLEELVALEWIGEVL